MRGRIDRCWIVWAALVLGGCDDGLGGAMLDIGRPDLAPPVADLAPPRDRATAPDASLGLPCDDGGDCPSGFCVAHDDGRRICSERCGNDDDCPEDWLCRQVSNAGPDVTFICVPEASPCGGVDLETDPDNCGACGERCAYAFAEALCAQGECAMGGCLEGHHDLDDDPATGCEYACIVTREGVEACDEIDNDCDGATDEGFDLEADPAHCGACGSLCERANAEARCEGGVCTTIACLDGYLDVDGEPDNGCEAVDCVPAAEACDAVDNDCDGAVDEAFDRAADPQNCGGCGQVCRLPNAVPACVGGQCIAEACVDGFVDVDGDPANGCEGLQCTPVAESCDAEDNDCDGRVDEGLFLGDGCLDNQAREGVCGCGAAGAVACVVDVGGSPTPRDPTERAGDGTDNDCDGVVDER